VSTVQREPISGQAGRRPDGLTRFKAAFTVLRDVAMTGLALYGVWHQESSGRVNPWLLLTYVVILGLVPASHALALLRSLPQQLPASSGPQQESATPALPQ
jgi:hypothetical protein